MGKYCTNCGAQIEPGARFCISCGAIVQQAQVPGPIPSYNHRYVKKPGGFKKLIIPVALSLVLLAILAVAVPWVLDKINGKDTVSVEAVNGQFYANRAITISGEGFGDYDMETCKVTIDGKEAPIVAWENKNITVIVPAGVKGGKKGILVTNPPVFKKKSIKKEFVEHKKTQLAKAALSPAEDKLIEGKGFTLYVPAGSVSEEKEIILYKYDTPGKDLSPYHIVTDEYEITGPEGGHVIFNKPVFFGVDVADEEEASQSSIQIFDEYMGEWVNCETVYNKAEGKLYMVTTHFSAFRRFASEMYKGFKREAGKAADKVVETGKKAVDYVYNAGKSAGKTVVKLGEEAYVLVKDATVEEFVGVSDSGGEFIVYYRVSDAANDPSIPEKARLMAAAFSTSYDRYKGLFGEDGVPPTKRKVMVPKTRSFEKGHPPVVLEEDESGAYVIELHPAPIKVYIDPRYNTSGAKYSLVSGNITMPSTYASDLESTCAHELFHAVQHKQLGIEQAIMGNRLKDYANAAAGGDGETHKYFSNNKWFLEATAEYAARFIGTKVGVGGPLDNRIDASRPYYAFNSYHEYGVSSFLDYIITSRQTDEGSREQGFKELWNNVAGNYGVLSDIPSILDEYVKDKLGESAQTLYKDFWREAFTRRHMPDPSFIGGGLKDIANMGKTGSSGSMEIKENGVGIFRYVLNQSVIPKDDTALARSFWFEATPSGVIGDVYCFPGIAPADRPASEPTPAGYVNPKDNALKEALVPFKAGETLGLVVYFKSIPPADANLKVNILPTSIKWDNQKDIEEKVQNATLTGKDKLKFTPTLPKTRPGDPKFTAVVLLNNNEEYKTEIDKVEDGKPFEVAAPMKELPPSSVSVNIKILRDNKLVHEYQSGEVLADAKVYIEGPRDVVYEITKEELPLKHNFKAVAVPPGEYRFDWYFGDGFAQETKGKEESSVSDSYNEFKQYKPKVTLYDMKGNILSSYDITLTLKEKEIKPTPTPTPIPTPTPTPVKEEPAEPAGTGSVSGTIEIPKEGIKLNYTVSGGNITEATDDGWDSKFFIKGTVRPGETISISVSGNGTNFSTWHHINQDREATMSIWFNASKGEEGRQNLTIAPGDSGSLTGSFTVPEGTRRVEVVGYIGNTWINPYGGGSRSLILNAKYEVEAP